jgi:hypothetical protein
MAPEEMAKLARQASEAAKINLSIGFEPQWRPVRTLISMALIRRHEPNFQVKIARPNLPIGVAESKDSSPNSIQGASTPLRRAR